MQINARSRISLLSLIITILTFAISPVNSQAINPDLIDFTTIKLWPDLKICLQNCFTGYYDIQHNIGCTTNACLCRADTLGDAAQKVQTKALSSCSNIADQTSASSILTAYCSAKGYTNVIPPTILATGASCTASPSKTIISTSYVTVLSYSTVYVRSAGALSYEVREVPVLIAIGALVSLFALM